MSSVGKMCWKIFVMGSDVVYIMCSHGVCVCLRRAGKIKEVVFSAVSFKCGSSGLYLNKIPQSFVFWLEMD